MKTLLIGELARGGGVGVGAARLYERLQLSFPRPSERPQVSSPLNQPLGGLPPLLMQVGSGEEILSDCSRLAERAGLAGM